MKTFIKITEIWVPDQDHSHLILKEGTYGNYKAFEKLSRSKQFSYQQGLPGKAWSSGHPIVLTDLEHSYFERTKDAQQAGLTSAIAFPIFSGEFLIAVIVFLCGDDEEHAGAIEIWTNYADNKNELTLLDGYYGTLENFALVARQTHFAKGSGLPGLVWKREMPVLIDNLADSAEFIRAKDAQIAGISTGIGIPLAKNKGQFYTLVLLSANATPIAKRMQIWLLDKQHQHLYCHDAYGTQNDSLAQLFEGKTFAKGEDIIGKVWLTGLPSITESHFNGQLKDPAGISALLAIPVIERGVLKAVVTFMF